MGAWVGGWVGEWVGGWVGGCTEATGCLRSLRCMIVLHVCVLGCALGCALGCDAVHVSALASDPSDPSDPSEANLFTFGVPRVCPVCVWPQCVCACV